VVLEHLVKVLMEEVLPKQWVEEVGVQLKLGLTEQLQLLEVRVAMEHIQQYLVPILPMLVAEPVAQIQVLAGMLLFCWVVSVAAVKVA